MSRSKMLKKVLVSQGNACDLPDLTSFIQLPRENLQQKFCETLHSIGGSSSQLEEQIPLEIQVRNVYPNAKRIEFKGFQKEGAWISASPHSLKDIDVLVVHGLLGVAENGAIWLTEKQLGQRIAPFIAEYVVVVLQEAALVATMHEAYQAIEKTEPYEFGVFIAGPSKTADIEQSLVIGAHGARGLHVLLER